MYAIYKRACSILRPIEYHLRYFYALYRTHAQAHTTAPCVLNGPEGGSQKVEVENGVVQEWCISLHWIAFWAPCSGILSQIICNHVDSLPSNDRIVIVVVDDLGSFHAINEILVLSYPVQWVFYSERVCSASEFHHQTCTWIHTHSAHSFAIRMHRSCMSS